MYLSGSNTIKSGDYFAGIHVDQGAELTISSKLGDFSTSGNLEVTGGLESAGIGGSIVGTGTITINGGTIIANGGEAAAGIGGEAEGTVTVNPPSTKVEGIQLS